MKNILGCIKKSGLIVLFIISAGVLNGCKDDDEPTPAPTPSPGQNEVWMQNNAFNPATITVSVNATVKWVNKNGTTHNVVSTGLFSSGDIPAGGTFSYHFMTAGTFDYTCTLHSGMNGKVIVQ